ncbi:MAG: hypothetical protein A2X59_07835 [Nitrospirae bacterium GWC2_42_7]|nr:MAG: hypothetical protein A2X59_07835 [Nitrospirae bacterium GWC2_42_7]
MKYNKLIWIALFVFSAAYNFPIIKEYLYLCDEGTILVGAERILKGHLPYADFWSVYPPGQFYLLAFIFKLFGSSVLIERIYDITVKSLLCMVSFLITRKLGFSNKISIISFGMSLVWIGYSGFQGYPVYTAMVFIFIGVYFFMHYIEKAQNHWLIYCGFFVTSGAMFRHDLAGMAAVVILIALFLRKITDTQTTWHPILYYFFAVLLSGVPIAAYLINAIGIEPIVNQLIWTPMEIMQKYRGLPYPFYFSFESIPFFLFPGILLVGLIISLVLIIKDKTNTKFSYGLFILSFMGILFLNQVRVRSDIIHLLPAALVGVIILPSLYSFALSSQVKPISVARSIAVFIFVVLIGAIFIGPVAMKVETFKKDYFEMPKRSVIPRAGYSSMTNDLRDLVLYIQNNTTENDTIYIGVKNHDQFIISDIVIYFLAGRNYSTKYHELCPGVTNRPEIQREIINEIKKSPTKIVVLSPGYWYEPNYTRFDARTNILDDYISENFELVKRFKEYEVWMNKSLN